MTAPERGGKKATHTRTALIHTRLDRLSPTVNPPIERGSTLLFDSESGLYDDDRPTYGRMGHTVHRELEAGLCALESADQAVLTPNGLAACALAISALCEAGDRVLFADTLYGPTRRFCEKQLGRIGVAAQKIDTLDEAAVRRELEAGAALLVLETPSSLTFETPPLADLLNMARAAGTRTVVDNTWAAGIALRPLEIGADASVQALTKYIVGHADVLGGAVMARGTAAARIRETAEHWGIALSPDDAYSALRGLRTLPVRYEAHGRAGLALAEYLQVREEVADVLHPALPGSAVESDLYTGMAGLFGFTLKQRDDDRIANALGALDVFGMGFSWGGFESLLIPANAQLTRSFGRWAVPRKDQPALFRVHAGLEHPGDLMDALGEFLSRAG